MAAIKPLVAQACLEFFHADEAFTFLCSTCVPNFATDRINFFFRVSTIYLTSIFLKFHKLFVAHTIDVWIVRVDEMFMF